MDIMIIPIVSEKANAISEKNNRFSFKVSPSANKYQIKDIVEKMYDVKVARKTCAIQSVEFNAAR